jgi:hypothetical protein
MSSPHGASHAPTYHGHPITQLAGNPARLAEAQMARGLPAAGGMGRLSTGHRTGPGD